VTLQFNSLTCVIKLQQQPIMHSSSRPLTVRPLPLFPNPAAATCRPLQTGCSCFPSGHTEVGVCWQHGHQRYGESHAKPHPQHARSAGMSSLQGASSSSMHGTAPRLLQSTRTC
jgi:hypothetical protein